MISVMMLLVLAAFVLVIASAMGKAPLWAAVLLLVIQQVLMLAPIG